MKAHGQLSLGIFLSNDTDAKYGKFCVEKMQFLSDIYKKSKGRKSKGNIEIFAFRPEDVDLNLRKISAYFLDGAFLKIPKTVDFPNVVYDRFFRPNEGTSIKNATDVRRLFLETGVKFLNSPTVYRLTQDKWEVYKKMIENGVQTPITNILTDISLNDFKSREDFKDCFLKPRRGMKGKGIYKLSMDTKGKLTLINEKKNIDVTLRDCIACGKYLIQKAVPIPKAKLDGEKHAFDVRILAQRPSNQWEIVDMLGRLGKTGENTSNISGGGKPIIFKNIIKEIDFPVSLHAVKKRLNKICFRAIAMLEKQIPDIFEIGFDVCLDAFARPWMLEVNAKPMIFFYMQQAQEKTLQGKYFSKVYNKILTNILIAAVRKAAIQ